jgi:hypothetical protein
MSTPPTLETLQKELEATQYWMRMFTRCDRRGGLGRD